MKPIIRVLISSAALASCGSQSGPGNGTATADRSGEKPEWHFDTITDKMTDARRAVTYVHSTEGGQFDNRAMLIIKCDTPGTNSLYVEIKIPEYLGEPPSGAGKVRYRLDKTPADTIAASINDDYALITSSEEGYEGWMRKLSKASELTVELTSFRFETHTYSFKIEGVADQIKHVAAICQDRKWL